MGACTPRDDSAHYIGRLSRLTRQGQVDSLKVVRDELSLDENTKTREHIMEMVADSADNIYAMSLILTSNPDDVADLLMNHLSTDKFQAVCRAYRLLGETDNITRMSAEMQKRFDRMSPEAQAVFLTSTLTPEQIARGIRPGDTELKDFILKIYSDDNRRERFLNALSSNK